ncbi:conserved Plasmodium protein, unknown function [Plasmodium chabaudi chabaudi]|uniref:RSE1/DDB1/CPSF1 C-terminal domain-containing protein n=1 Tax=Plasmodium chabaudi chabaudi TaxID=31271 RepID=A0A1C6YJI7_PLACU|nr:conserved Plasmodium protein, unknown function [Plasmodium chabaudi chabaudi]
MIDIKIEEVRNSSEVDHCECCNLLNEKSVEFVVIKNKDLYIYKYRNKKCYLIYDTKINGPVIKLVVLKNVFKNKNKYYSGILLIYKNLHFIIYKYEKSLNTLVAVLKHHFVKDAKFQSLFYSLPLSVHYTHIYETKNEENHNKKIKKKNNKHKYAKYKRGSRTKLISLNADNQFYIKKKKNNNKINIATKSINNNDNEKKAIKSLLQNANLPSKNSENNHDSIIFNDNNNVDNNLLDTEFANVQNILNSYYLNFKKKIKSKKKNNNFCEFHISFSYDFKVIYTIFYTTKNRNNKIKNNKIFQDPNGLNIDTTYFSNDLQTENVTLVDLGEIYKHFIFIKKIFYYTDHANVLIQTDPINIGHTKLEELSLKLLLIKIEKNKFDIIHVIKDFPNDMIDIQRIGKLVICLCHDYIYILNLESYKKIIYFFNKSCYMNNTFQLIKNDCLFYDHTYFNISFKISSMYIKKNKIFILNKKSIIEGTISKDINNLINLITWNKIFNFKSYISFTSFFSINSNFYFLCCYNGLSGLANIQLIRKSEHPEVSNIHTKLDKLKKMKKMKTLKKVKIANKLSNEEMAKEAENGKSQNVRKRKRMETDDFVEKKKKNTNESVNDGTSEEDKENSKSLIENNLNNQICEKSNRVKKSHTHKQNNIFLFHLLNYLNKNTNINEYTKELNNRKYDFLFKKYKKKIKILENKYSRINTKGLIEYSSPLFILKKKKKKKNINQTDNTKQINLKKTKDIHIIDNIQCKGMLVDISKLSYESCPIYQSTYMGLFGCKHNSALEKIYFQIPSIIKLIVFSKSFNINSVCSIENESSKSDEKRDYNFKYVLINLEKSTNPLPNDKKGILLCLTNLSILKNKNSSKYYDHYEENKFKRNLLLCECSEKISQISENENENVNYSDDEHSENNETDKCSDKNEDDKCSDKNDEDHFCDLVNDNYEHMICVLKTGENRHPISVSSIETIQGCLNFFKNFPLIYFNIKDVDIYVKKIYLIHILREKEEDDDCSSNSIVHEMDSIKYILAKRFWEFFSINSNKGNKNKTSLNLNGNCISLLKYDKVLIQVCQNEINIFYNNNTYILLNKISIETEKKVISCKLIKNYLTILNSYHECIIYNIDDAVINLAIQTIERVVSIFNLCVLHCLLHDNREELVNLVNLIKFVDIENTFNKSSFEISHLLNIQSSSAFLKFIKKKITTIDNILNLDTQINNVKCISTIEKNKKQFLCYLNSISNTFTIYNIVNKKIIFESNYLLNVPKYVYKIDAKKTKVKHEEVDVEDRTNFLNLYKKEEIINILFFKLGKSYLLIIFLTGRPILIYKSFSCSKFFKNLKLKIYIHKHIKPIPSNIHFFNDPNNLHINKIVTTSRQDEYNNDGYYMYVCKNDNTNLNKKKKKKNSSYNKCIIVYPYVDLTKLQINELDEEQKKHFYQSVLKNYDTDLPVLFFSSYKGKLFIHNLDTSKMKPSSITNIAYNTSVEKYSHYDKSNTLSNIKGVKRIGKNLFLSFTNSNFNIFSIGTEEYNSIEKVDPNKNEIKNINLFSSFSNNLYLNKKNTYNDNKNCILLFKSPNLINFKFNDNFISKLFISYPYICKFSVSQNYYILKKKKKNNNDQTVSKQNEDEHTVTFGKVLCLAVRIKYDEYYSLKKILKKRLNLQKEELKNNNLYENEDAQCISNPLLDDCINNQYTHTIKSFVEEDIETATNLNDEKIKRNNNKLIQSIKTKSKYYKLLLLHENSKHIYGYFIFEHSEQIQSISFGQLNGIEYIYVSTSLNINERIETQGNIYILDFSNIFTLYDENVSIDNLFVNNKENPNPDRNNKEDTEGQNKNDNAKNAKLTVYMKKTYNSSVTHILPFYFYSETSPKKYRNILNDELINKFEINWSCDKNENKWNDDTNLYSSVLHCINSKMYIHEIKNKDFTKGAFIDNNFYVSDIKIVRNFIIISDLYKGIFINMYNYEEQYDSRSIISISKNFYNNNLNILCCHYIIYNSNICIIAMDVYNNFFVFGHKNKQDIDNLYIYNYFNFNRRILKFTNELHENKHSNSALSISNDGSIHIYHPLNNKAFIFFKQIFKIVKKYIFPNLALNVNSDLKPDIFVQSIILNLHKKTNALLVGNVIFHDLLRQIPFYSSEVLYELFCQRANLLNHITIGDLINELHSLSKN